MTHWLVYVDRFYKGLKKIGGLAKDNYYQDKRNFIETMTNLILNSILVIAMLEWIVLPIPTIPKQTLPMTSSFEFLFVVMKPFWLHVLALGGCLLFLKPRTGLFSFYVHPIFSLIIKVRNYAKFVQAGKRNKIKP